MPQRSLSQERPIYDFPREDVCAAYFDFLKGNQGGDTTGCHPISAYLIETQHFGREAFFRTYLTRMEGRENAFVWLMRAVDSALFHDPMRALYDADIADRFHYAQLYVSRDPERAHIYGMLLGSLKLEAVASLCDPIRSACTDLPHYSGVYLRNLAAALGTTPTPMAKLDAEDIIYCLMRSDGRQVPIEEVLASPRFRDCLP